METQNLLLNSSSRNATGKSTMQTTNKDTKVNATSTTIRERIVKAWNVRNNVKSLYHRRPSALKALDGLRALALLWVVVYHCLIFSQVPESTLHKWGLGLIHAGQMGVDLFFVLSGFLIHHLLAREYHASGRIAVLKFLARRWLRLWPAYLAIIPIYFVNAAQREFASKWIWTNLLMVNNYIGPGRFTNGFMGHTWSICVEFQFYIVSPFVVLAMYKDTFLSRHGKWPIAPPVVLALLSGALRIMVIVVNFYHPNAKWQMYTPMYTRLGPYAVGMIASHYYRLWKESNECIGASALATKANGNTTTHSSVVVAVDPEVGMCGGSKPPAQHTAYIQLQDAHLGNTASTATPDAQSGGGGGDKTTRWCGCMQRHHVVHIVAGIVWFAISWGGATIDNTSNVPWMAFSLMYSVWARTLLGAAVAWFMYACLTGKARWLNAILSSTAFVPIARLSYSVYLCQFAGVMPALSAFPLSPAATVGEVWYGLLPVWALTFVIAFSIAFVVYMCVERPIMLLRPV